MWTRARRPAAGGEALDPRIARSRAVIVEAALEHFLRNGYVGASVDDIAAEARVSKRTVYNIFGGKEELFRQIMADALTVAEQFSTDVVTTLAGAEDAEDVEAELRAAGRTLVRTVLSPRVVRLRRLLIGEAERFPELAMQYYQRAPDRVMDALAEALARLDERGLLAVVKPRIAAEHFAFLVLGAPLDRALFTAGEPEPSAEEIDREAEGRVREGVEVFLCAYAARL